MFAVGYLPSIFTLLKQALILAWTTSHALIMLPEKIIKSRKRGQQMHSKSQNKEIKRRTKTARHFLQQLFVSGLPEIWGMIRYKRQCSPHLPLTINHQSSQAPNLHSPRSSFRVGLIGERKKVMINNPILKQIPTVGGVSHPMEVSPLSVNYRQRQLKRLSSDRMLTFAF